MGKNADREKRLAQALRDNLRKRKATAAIPPGQSPPVGQTEADPDSKGL